MSYSSSDNDFEDLPQVSSSNVFERNAPRSQSLDSGVANNFDADTRTDDVVVASHYNARDDAGHEARARSAILHLRVFNNWIKNVMISEFSRGRNLKVLDLACGKGGDLGKWNRLAVTHLTGVDIAAISLQHARQRYTELKPRYECKFVEYDAFRRPFYPGLLPIRFYDTISCQFAFHYSFESLETARTAIQNVASSLARGGYFLGTVPNADEIMNRLRNESKDKQTLEGRFFKIVFDQPVDMNAKTLSPFGMRYLFSMVDALDNCPEYLIPMPVLRAMCQDAGLLFVQELTFPRFYDHFSKMSEYENLLRRMGVIDIHDGNLILGDDERELVSLYTTFVFRKSDR